MTYSSSDHDVPDPFLVILAVHWIVFFLSSSFCGIMEQYFCALFCVSFAPFVTKDSTPHFSDEFFFPVLPMFLPFGCCGVIKVRCTKGGSKSRGHLGRSPHARASS